MFYSLYATEIIRTCRYITLACFFEVFVFESWNLTNTEVLEYTLLFDVPKYEMRCLFVFRKVYLRDNWDYTKFLKHVPWDIGFKDAQGEFEILKAGVFIYRRSK